jgi:hypothetical protein
MAVAAAPACKPQTLQTSVCTLTVAKRRARAPRMGTSPGRTPFAWGEGSEVFRVLHPRRDVALALQHAPDIDVVWALDVEDEVGVARQRQGAQAR